MILMYAIYDARNPARHVDRFHVGFNELAELLRDSFGSEA